MPFPIKLHYYQCWQFLGQTEAYLGMARGASIIVVVVIVAVFVRNVLLLFARVPFDIGCCRDCTTLKKGINFALREHYQLGGCGHIPEMTETNFHWKIFR